MVSFLTNTDNNGYNGHLSPIDSRMTLNEVINKSSTGIIYVNQSISRNTWYHCVLEKNNGNLTMKLYNNDTLVRSVTGSTTNYNNISNLEFFVGWEVNAKISIKNIKVKAL